MTSISKTYTLKFQLIGSSQYKFTEKGKCFNQRTGRELKQVYQKGSIGFCVNGRFRSLTWIRKNLEKIPSKEYCPF